MKTKKIMLSAAALVVATSFISSTVLAVTADDVVCSNCVGTADIAPGSIFKNHIANYTITGIKLAPTIIGTGKLVDGAVTSGKLAPNSVGSGKLKDNIVLGSGAATGSLDIVATDGTNRLAMPSGGGTDFILGQSTAGNLSSPGDVDFAIRDVSAVTTENALYFNASTAGLVLGNGTVSASGGSGSISLRSSTGADVTSLSPIAITQPLAGNGAVKAWAKINSDGTVQSCYKCSSSATDTQNVGTGFYEVDFTPLGTDITARPRTATITHHGSGVLAHGEVALGGRSGDLSAIWVRTANAGTALNRPFTIVIY